MIAENMKKLVENSSVIREMFEEGKRLTEIYGKDKVYDFSLGNPIACPPEEIRLCIKDILDNDEAMTTHGYMNNSGYEDVRLAIAKYVNYQHKLSLTHENIIMTVGAAGALNIALKVFLDPGDEVIVFAPYFVEYNNYVNNHSGVTVIIPPRTNDFQMDMVAFERAITNKTKVVIINSPNNPSGAVYSKESIKELSAVLEQKQKELGRAIYLVSDEPYRNIVYGDVKVPYIMKYYRNSLVAYSYSKSLSLPGERIGYLAISADIDALEETRAALNIANRILGFVNAPSLFQKVVGRCVALSVDSCIYEKNMEYLYENLIDMGFECMKPQGTFYMFPQILGGNDREFCNNAKKYNLLLVPGSAFACPGFFRIAYCVPYDTVVNSMDSFKRLAKEYGR